MLMQGIPLTVLIASRGELVFALTLVAKDSAKMILLNGLTEGISLVKIALPDWLTGEGSMSGLTFFVACVLSIIKPLSKTSFKKE